MTNLGPMAGQANHFCNYAAQRIDYPIQRHTDEVRRLYGVMDRCLAHEQFLAVDHSNCGHGMLWLGWAARKRRIAA